MTEETRKQLEVKAASMCEWHRTFKPECYQCLERLEILQSVYELGEKAGSSAQRDALVVAIPWLFEYGSHQHKHCYRGSDDGCYCGLDDAKKVIEAALDKKGFRHHQEGQ